MEAIMNEAVSIISVLGTVSIAIFSVVAPHFFDLKKVKLEAKTAQVRKINETALELLGRLSHLRHWVSQDIVASAGESVQQVYTELQVKHYAWEQAIWSKLNSDDQERVRKLRHEFEGVHTPDAFKDRISDLSEEILSLTKVAIYSDK
jgi:hypothetical protein